MSKRPSMKMKLLKALAFAVLCGLAIVGSMTVAQLYFHVDLKGNQLSKTQRISQDDGKPVVPENINLLTGQPLLDALKSGGLVLFMRHFESDHRKFHEDPIKTRHLEMTLEDFKNSGDEQRHLSDYGRTRARLVGEAMKTLGVPIKRVCSSPYIRAVDGATLLADRPPDEITKNLLHRGGGFTAKMMKEAILPYLSTPPEPNTNTILMSHRPQMDDIHDIQEGQTFVFRPLGDGKFNMIGAIYDTDWTEAQVSVDLLGLRYVEYTLNGADETAGAKL